MILKLWSGEGLVDYPVYSTTDDYDPDIGGVVNVTGGKTFSGCIYDTFGTQVGALAFPSGAVVRVRTPGSLKYYFSMHVPDVANNTKISFYDDLVGAGKYGVVCKGDTWEDLRAYGAIAKINESDGTATILPTADNYDRAAFFSYFTADLSWYKPRVYALGHLTDDKMGASGVAKKLYLDRPIGSLGEDGYISHTMDDGADVGLRIEDLDSYTYWIPDSNTSRYIAKYDGSTEKWTAGEFVISSEGKITAKALHSFKSYSPGAIYMSDNPQAEPPTLFIRSVSASGEPYQPGYYNYDNISPEDNATFWAEVVLNIDTSVPDPVPWPDEIPPDQGGGQLGPPNTPSGGDGTFDDTSDVINLPTLPNINGQSSATIFHPTQEQMDEFVDYIWSGSLWTELMKGNLDPLDMIISLHLLPIPIVDSGTAAVKIGNIFSPSLEFNFTDQGYIDYACGSLEVKPYYGSCLDYEPHTTVQIYLPYIGINTLDVSDVMGSTLTVRYRIEVSSGSCVAIIRVDNDQRNIHGEMYQYPGNMSIPMPLFGTQGQALQRIMGNIALTGMVMVGSSAIGGALGAGASSGAAASATKAATAGQAAGKIIPFPGTQMPATPGKLTQIGSGLSQAGQLAGISAVLPKPDYGSNMIKGINPHTGNVNYSAGWFGPQKPYLIISRPNQAVAENTASYKGYPCNMERKLGDLTGYTEISDIHPTGFSCSADELEEVVKLLGEGVLL